MIRQKVAVS